MDSDSPNLRLDPSWIMLNWGSLVPDVELLQNKLKKSATFIRDGDLSWGVNFSQTWFSQHGPTRDIKTTLCVIGFNLRLLFVPAVTFWLSQYLSDGFSCSWRLPCLLSCWFPHLFLGLANAAGWYSASQDSLYLWLWEKFISLKVFTQHCLLPLWVQTGCMKPVVVRCIQAASHLLTSAAWLSGSLLRQDEETTFPHRLSACVVCSDSHITAPFYILLDFYSALPGVDGVELKRQVIVQKVSLKTITILCHYLFSESLSSVSDVASVTLLEQTQISCGMFVL